MKYLLSLLLVPLISFGQKRFCEPINGLIDLDSENITLSLKGYNIESEYDLITPKNSYQKYLVAGGEEGVVLIMKTMADLEQDFGNQIEELKVLKGDLKPIKRGLKRNDISEFEVLYDIEKDDTFLSGFGRIKYEVRWVSESSYNEIIEAKRLEAEAEKQKVIRDSIRKEKFLQVTALESYIGTYKVKVSTFDGRKIISDTHGTLYLTQEGITLKWSFLTGGLLRGALRKGRSELDFELGVFEADISSGTGDLMILSINEDKSAGSISRLLGTTQLGTITFIIEE